MWSESTTARPALNAIWNWESKKRNTAGERAAPAAPKGRSEKGIFSVHKKFKNYYKEIQKSYCKLVSKELQYGYSKGTSPAECEIFFFLFFGISGTGSPPPAVLLHSRDPCAAQAVSRFVCKKARPFWTSFFASINHAKPASHAGKYDLTPFWWAICLFFCKGHLQSLARRGFVFRLALWYSIYNQFIGCKHESD